MILNPFYGTAVFQSPPENIRKLVFWCISESIEKDQCIFDVVILPSKNRKVEFSGLGEWTCGGGMKIWQGESTGETFPCERDE